MCRPDNKISKAAAPAFIERRPFRRDNTEVVVTSPSCAVLKLYGHVIGENSESRGIYLTMAGWGIRWFRKNWEWHYGDRVLENLREVVEV